MSALGTQHLLADLSWPETRDLLPSVELVLIPLGAHEQHGPAAVMATATIRADALCRAAARRVARYPPSFAVRQLT